MTKNVKLYKNSARNTSEKTYKNYIPQYQLIGAEPGEVKSSVVSNQYNTPKASVVENNPRLRRPGIRQPYAEKIDAVIGRGKAPVPNVGNNMEHTWSSVDGDIIDDFESPIMDSSEFIDNNDYVTDAALMSPSDLTRSGGKMFLSKQDLEDMGRRTVVEVPDDVVNVVDESLISFLHSLKEEQYTLMIGESTIAHGSLLEVQEQAALLVFGEHEVCDGNPVPVEDILILKRIKVKVGLFLE